MDFDTFKQLALVTESKPASLRVNHEVFFLTLALAWDAANIADMVKKAAFYGKTPEQEKFMRALDGVYANVAALTALAEKGVVMDTTPGAGLGLQMKVPGSDDMEPLDLSGMNLRLAHAFIGDFGESGELIKALLDSIVGHKPIDRVNVGEEYADKDWYKAIGFDELNLSEPLTREAVIAKLRLRYKGGYSDNAAINRDTDAEREVLNEKIGG